MFKLIAFYSLSVVSVQLILTIYSLHDRRLAKSSKMTIWWKDVFMVQAATQLKWLITKSVDQGRDWLNYYIFQTIYFPKHHCCLNKCTLLTGGILFWRDKLSAFNRFYKARILWKCVSLLATVAESGHRYSWELCLCFYDMFCAFLLWCIEFMPCLLFIVLGVVFLPLTEILAVSVTSIGTGEFLRKWIRNKVYRWPFELQTYSRLNYLSKSTEWTFGSSASIFLISFCLRSAETEGQHLLQYTYSPNLSQAYGGGLEDLPH